MAEANPEGIDAIASGVAQLAPTAAGDAMNAVIESNPEAAVAAATAMASANPAAAQEARHRAEGALPRHLIPILQMAATIGTTLLPNRPVGRGLQRCSRRFNEM